jgi:hypothetical protein
MNRRDLLKLAGAAALAHCAGQTTVPAAEPARLIAQPRNHEGTAEAGTFPLRLGVDRDGLLLVRARITRTVRRRSSCCCTEPAARRDA